MGDPGIRGSDRIRRARRGALLRRAAVHRTLSRRAGLASSLDQVLQAASEPDSLRGLASGRGARLDRERPRRPRRVSWRSPRTSGASLGTRRGQQPFSSGPTSAPVWASEIVRASSTSSWHPSPASSRPADRLCTARSTGRSALSPATLERYEQAERHFAAAAEIEERLGAQLFLARTHASWARALIARGRPEDLERATAHARAGRGDRRAPGRGGHHARRRRMPRRPGSDRHSEHLTDVWMPTPGARSQGPVESNETHVAERVQGCRAQWTSHA